MNRELTAVMHRCVLLLLGSLVAVWIAAAASADEVKFRSAAGPEPIEGRYLVTLSADGDLQVTPGALVRAYGGRIEPYAAVDFPGFLYVAAPARARAMSGDPRVRVVEQIPAAAEALPPRVSDVDAGPAAAHRME